MKTNKSIIIILAIILVLSLIFNMYLGIKHTNLNLEYSNYKDETTNQINTLNQNLENLKKQNQELDTELKKVGDEINSYQQEILDSMAWFTQNSYIDDKSLYDNPWRTIEFLNRLDNCYEEGKTSKIKLGCFYLMNLKRLDLIYRQDLQTSQSIDKLQSIKEFVDNGGGDCEDYALFFKAEYNTIIRELNQTGELKNIKLESWKGTSSEEDKYWLEFSENWYLPYTEKVDIKEGYIYPNVVCGNLYDLNTNTINGHCMIGFTKNQIKTPEDIYELSSAPLIEPQNGEYRGLINEESSEVYIRGFENENQKFPSEIYEIITDNDLFLYSKNQKKWISYSLFDERLKELEDNLENF
jgi:predicted transglutaminase-like cysteine proteinase